MVYETLTELGLKPRVVDARPKYAERHDEEARRPTVVMPLSSVRVCGGSCGVAPYIYHPLRFYDCDEFCLLDATS